MKPPSLLAIAEFQEWRRNQPGGEALKAMVAGNGNVDHDDSLDDAKRDLKDARAFGVGYEKKGKPEAQHNVKIGQVNGVFRVYDSQHVELEELSGSTAFDALKDFMRKHADSVAGFGLAFEYLVEINPNPPTP